MLVFFWLEKLNERESLENTGMNEKTIFKWILQKYGQGRGMFIRGRTRTRIFCCKKFLNFPLSSDAINL
jgi:hypothetical protein